MTWQRYREIVVPEAGAGMRLDKFLARMFRDRSRSWIARGISAGQVRSATEEPHRASHVVRQAEALRLTLPGIAPSGPPPPFPTILHEDDRVVVVDKPAGMPCHPGGTRFEWAVITLAKQRWPAHRVDLVHRLDTGTSGVLALTKELDAARHLKAALKRGEAHKEYLAICRGYIPWDHQRIEAPIGTDDSVIRIRMGVVADGLASHTDVQVLARTEHHTQVQCILHTGRTHQIRVHLHHMGHSLLGDRMYGVPDAVFLRTLEHGADPWVVERAGAPRHALHAHRITLPHPDGGPLTVEAPLAPDMARWWAHPEVLPHDAHSATDAGPTAPPPP